MDDFVRPPDRQPLHVHSDPDSNKAEQGSIKLPPAPEIIRPSTDEPKDNKSPNDKQKKKFKFKLPVPKTKLQWIIFGFVATMLLAGSGFAIYWVFFHKTPPPPAPYVAPAPEPEPEPVKTTVSSKTTGRELQPADNDRNIYAVQIENSPDARPQFGLKEADIVSEAVAEGGITRFNAVFHDNVPSRIEPVRSLRPYYIDWFLPYTKAIAHAGGAPEALQDIRKLGLQDMDNTAGFFHRDSKRYAPHNLYTSGQEMLDLFAKRGYKPSAVTSLPRKEAKPADTPTASTINVKISSKLYNVSYSYDKTNNIYLRSEGGAPHKDAASGKQLSPDVVIVPILSKRIHSDRVHTVYGSVGSGKVYVFQDGLVYEGTWSKPSRDAQWKLTDKDGNEIKLNPGQTWFTVTDADGNVSYSP